MLYATTRSKHDVYTAYKAIHSDCAPDGGLYVPFRLPQWETAQIKALADQSFGQTVARVLNDFFSCGLTGWDVDFTIGRNPLCLRSVNHRVTVAELWYNPQRRFDHVICALSDKIRKEGVGEPAGNWMRIAISIAVIYGVYGECLRADPALADAPVDISVATGDFSVPMAAWYARKMGLPIGNIICGCNSNGGVWDLLHHGTFSCGSIAVKTAAPEADIAVPRDLERLIAATLGVDACNGYLQCCALGSDYVPAEEELTVLREGMFAAVISDLRINSTIPSVYHTSQYVFGPYGALAYGSLMDYRAKTGETRSAILICDRSPVCDGEYVVKALDIPPEQLPQLLTQG